MSAPGPLGSLASVGPNGSLGSGFESLGHGPAHGLAHGHGLGPNHTGESSPCSVSRSSSTASLNTARGGPGLAGPWAGRPHPDAASLSSAPDTGAGAPLRPRVRSFGEKDTLVSLTPLSSSGEGRWSLTPSLQGSSLGFGPQSALGALGHRDDFVTLRVHGIADAGPDVRRDLMQVLQNRLDLAVLEVLSVMLARNPMCKLSAEDVHFIQRPHVPPETTVQVTVASSPCQT